MHLTPAGRLTRFVSKPGIDFWLIYAILGGMLLLIQWMFQTRKEMRKTVVLSKYIRIRFFEKMQNKQSTTKINCFYKKRHK